MDVGPAQVQISRFGFFEHYSKEKIFFSGLIMHKPHICGDVCNFSIEFLEDMSVQSSFLCVCVHVAIVLS